MSFGTGDIITQGNIIFKDTGMLDLYTTGRPVLVVDITDDIFYFLAMTIGEHHFYEIKQYGYYRTNNLYLGLSRNGFVNFKNIYKRKIEDYAVREKVDDAIFRLLLARFIRYQEDIMKDEYYDEIKDKLSEKIKCYRS